jgi:DNA uptake protein ComE-like DNA-binding protein
VPKNLDLNIATERELASIQGMNQYLAGRIVEYRNQKGEINSWEELKQIPGLPGNTLDTLKAHGCTVGGKAA